MATGPQTPSFPLDLGMRNTAEDQPQPFGPGAALVESRNTRLGIIPGIPTKAPLFAAFGATVGNERRSGIVPSGLGSSLLLAKRGCERFTSAGHSTRIAPSLSSSPTARQNSFFPYDVQGYGVVPGSRSFASPATCTDGAGNTWFASFRENPAGGSALMVSALSATGEVVLTPSLVTTVAATPDTRPFVGLTPYPSGGSVSVWWFNGTSIRVLDASIGATTLDVVFSSPATVYTPISAPAGSIAVHCDRHQTLAWLVCRNSALATSITVLKVDRGPWTTTALTIPQGANVNMVSIRHITNAGEYVAVGVSKAAGSTGSYLIDGTTMAVFYSLTGPAANGQVASSFYRDGNTSFNFVLAATHPFGGSPTPASGTWIQSWDILGATQGVAFLPWKGLISNGTWDRQGTDVVPLFALQNVYSINSSTDPLSANWVADPAVEIYRSVDPNQATMVARFAVDTALIYTSSTGATVANSGNFEATDSLITLAYLEDSALSGDTPTPGFVSRYVALSTGLVPPAYVVDSEGVAIIAPGSAYWDGNEVAEWCPTSIPVISASATGGTIVTAAGTYRLSAVVQWKDATGQLRQSAPARVVSLTANGAGDQPRLRVTLPCTMRDGLTQERPQIVVYSSQAGQTSLYAQTWLPTAWTAHYVEFGAIPTPAQNAMTPAIRTDGTAGFPLVPQCPPSFQAVTIVGNRMWGLSLGELWFSKPKEPGIAFEFSSELRLAVPASAGKAFELEELRGSLVMLAERGAWVVTGQGPDASLGGAWFNDPEQISDLPCTSRLSVVRTPAGIFFQSGSRFATLGGDLGTAILEDYATTDGKAYTAINLPDSKEVIWFSDQQLIQNAVRHVVFNYSERKFTHWANEVALGIRSACVDKLTGLVFALASVDGVGLYTMDPDSVGNAEIRLISGAIRLGAGDEADNCLQHVLVSCKRLSDHTASVLLYQDYGTQSARNEAYTASDLQNAANTVSGVNSQRYTLQVEAKDGGAMRAAKVSVFLTGAGDCVRPYAVTLVYSQKSGTKSDAVFQTAKR